MKKISNFFTRHQGILTIISLIFIYLGSFNLMDNIDNFIVIKIITLVCGIIIVFGIFVNPFVRMKLDIKNRIGKSNGKSYK